MPGGRLMEALMYSRILKRLSLKFKQLISVFSIFDRKVEINPSPENILPPGNSTDRLIPPQDPADSSVPLKDSPSTFISQNPLTISEDNEVAEIISPSKTILPPQDPVNSPSPLQDLFTGSEDNEVAETNASPEAVLPPQDPVNSPTPFQDLPTIPEHNEVVERNSPSETLLPPQDHVDSTTTPLENLYTRSEDKELAAVRSKLLGSRSHYEVLQKDFGDVCHDVFGMLQDLCQRDSRFIYLQEAMTEFLDGDLGLRDRLRRRNQHIDSALAADNGYSFAASCIKLEWLIQNQSFPENDVNARFDFRLATFEIISALIYEILDVFNFDITVQESNVKHETSDYLSLLHRLYNRTKDREPKPRKQTINASKFNSQFNSDFTYQSELDPATDQVRVVELSPGSGDDSIECSLRVHSIKEDGIPEALSYVWGNKLSQEQILVDLQHFSVTENLLECLRGLRHPENPRTIWIDAICINQGNYEERNHQVRLMRDIYSQAKITVIYLTKNDVHLKLKRGKHLDPLPTDFGGVTINQFDLVSLLREFQTYSIDLPWSERQLALYIMILRCLKHMLSHAWWQRIWTLQEGALPESPPIVCYQGFSSTLQTLQSAIDILREAVQRSNPEHSRSIYAASNNLNRHPRTSEVLDMLELTRSQGVGSMDQPVLFRLRQNSKGEPSGATSYLYELLNGTWIYRATDPRDKIYALESLLPRCIGKLIRIDYSENCETLFAYTTVRCINSLRTYNIAAKFSLLIESTMRSNEHYAISNSETVSYPSWVLDFSNRDSGEYSNTLATDVADTVTFKGFLIRNGLKMADSQGTTQNPIFATPSSLFCDGMNIDDIYEAGAIEAGDYSDVFSVAILLAIDIDHRLKNRQESSEAGVEGRTSMDRDAIVSLMAFFCLYLPTEAFPNGEGDGLQAVRLKEIAGKTCFITENGLLGISTAPVQQGDSLCLLDDVPVYFVLRPVPDSKVEGQDGGSEATQRHRIVARAAVKGVDLPTLRETSPNCRYQNCRFQIV